MCYLDISFILSYFTLIFLIIHLFNELNLFISCLCFRKSGGYCKNKLFLAKRDIGQYD